MNKNMINKNDKVVKEGSLRKKGEENASFKNALLNKPVQIVDHNGQDILEGIENINLCSDSFLSDKKRNSESKLCEMNFKDCLSSDLLKRLEEGSPIKSSRTFKNERVDMNYLTNYTDKNEDDLEGLDEENSENPPLSFKDPHSRFYAKSNMINEMEKFYLLDDNNMEFGRSSLNCQEENLKNISVRGVQEKSLSTGRIPCTMPFLQYCNKIENPNRYHDHLPNFCGNQARDYFNFEGEENYGNYVNNSSQIKNNCMPSQNLHKKYAFSQEERAKTTCISPSPSDGRLFHLDENIGFYPKSYNQICKDRVSLTTTNLIRQREIHSENCMGQNPSNLFNDFSFNQSVNNLFKNQLEKLENNVEDQKISSLMFAEEQRSNRQNPETQYKLDTPNIVSHCNKANNSKSLNLFSNNSKKQNSISPQTQPMNSNQLNQNNTKEIMKSKCIQISNTKLYMHGKSGWTCNNCKNFNYESKTFYLKNLARIKCNRCGRPQIKNMYEEKEINANDANGESSISSTSISSANKNTIESLSQSSNTIYNENPKYASSLNSKNTCNISTSIINSKEPQYKKPTIQNEFNLNAYEQIKDSMESSKDSLSPSEISLKASSSDSKKKKKPFVERVGDWVCIKCKNLNFSFRLVCNRCQLTKQESENLFEQYMKNLMNYVKLNEILQNQIFNNSNLNNLIEFNGVNNQLMSNLNKNFQQNKLNIPNDPNLINYLKTKCINSNGFSPKTNYSTEESNSNLGICDNHCTEDSTGDKLGNKSK